ncbi:unnamed protein product [Aphanomyces euteiches]|uniref:F-actin-capping protein subunit beta n=1 Tax=Aphanomyces euteiches TaxID=100861 RepID=A0A6G0W6H7_9STRA|nr:hypothetical protein Ae201684_018272 [Aphanomyces euteiches]KAH9068744.1 hypothetical protein Ae201684P_004445 [Aphanomyces euteiches]KAH9143196.1 hypothetical protein AeRB84_012800 [Aphanomyces euteiches]
MSDEAMNACLNVLRRMPPGNVENDLSGLCQLQPDLADELYQRVDQPLGQALDPVAGRPFLLCDYNRDGDSHRSPWTNTYYPPIEDGEGFVPSDNLRQLEIQANEIFDVYREMYYQGGVSSVYMWDLEPGFAACILIKKDVHQQRFVENGGWNSIHVMEVHEKNDKEAVYTLTTTILLGMKVNRQELGHLNLDGNLTRQTERVMKFDSQSSHLSNMGRLVEDMEIEMRSNLDRVYISKTREVLNGIRKLQHGPTQGSVFVGELGRAVLQHGANKAQ